MPQRCGNCGGSIFRLRRSELGVEAECATCGAVIPLHAATPKSPQTLHPKPVAKSPQRMTQLAKRPATNIVMWDEDQAKAPAEGEKVHKGKSDLPQINRNS
jgi:hypothetical protein